ncbi:MAG: hypothetical protein OER88_13290, partial [Planctomycetota bacterium]|nr:hypothetical protein [Planctomycetota bacterium]
DDATKSRAWQHEIERGQISCATGADALVSLAWGCGSVRGKPGVVRMLECFVPRAELARVDTDGTWTPALITARSLTAREPASGRGPVLCVAAGASGARLAAFDPNTGAFEVLGGAGSHLGLAFDGSRFAYLEARRLVVYDLDRAAGVAIALPRHAHGVAVATGTETAALAWPEGGHTRIAVVAAPCAR